MYKLLSSALYSCFLFVAKTREHMVASKKGLKINPCISQDPEEASAPKASASTQKKAQDP